MVATFEERAVNAERSYDTLRNFLIDRSSPDTELDGRLMTREAFPRYPNFLLRLVRLADTHGTPGGRHCIGQKSLDYV